MSNLFNIISKIEEFAPPELAEDWDNSGWQVKLENNNISKVMLALSPTLDVIEQAINANCELLITHHPFIFSGLKTFSADNPSNLPLIKAIQGNLQVYSAHTNLDSTQDGIADVLANLLEIQNLSPLDGNLGRKGELGQPENLLDFVDKLKKVLKIDKLKLINPSNMEKIQKLALLPGSGGSLIPNLKDIDLYITGDVKYHDALEVNNFAVVDAGHFETEVIILPVLKDLISKLGAEIVIADEQLPWKIV